jgi:hypothetical protein
MINKTALFSLLASIIFISCSGREKTIGIGESIRHDDFEYSVSDFEKTEKIGNWKASGIFYIVHFRVQNDAKRVDHGWRNNVAYITDEKENIYENSNELQKQLNSIRQFGYKDSYLTQAGTTESTIMVFDVPNSVKEPFLKVRGDFLIGDLFDGGQFKKTKIKLF